jgi:phosphoribosyl 1,2-cyclic phosphodiesterase
VSGNTTSDVDPPGRDDGLAGYGAVSDDEADRARADVIVTFHGVRGSTPVQSDDVARYGGNTACVAVRAAGQRPLLFDLGTGLRFFGTTLSADEPFVGTCLLGHLHWDHVQGLPFFTPLLEPGAHLTIYAPAQDDGRHPGDVLAGVIQPPMFPVALDEIGGSVSVRRATPEFTVGGFLVRSARVPHNGVSYGYRVERAGASVVYISDHQEPADPTVIDPGVVALCRGADLLIHDAQYTAHELERKRTWGHCTIEYAVAVAAAAGVARLALFHHDPSHTDDELDRLTAAARCRGAELGVDVFGAVEGRSVTVG